MLLVITAVLLVLLGPLAAAFRAGASPPGGIPWSETHWVSKLAIIAISLTVIAYFITFLCGGLK